MSEIKSTWKGTPPCYTTHPALPLPGGAGLVVYGGSCSSPVTQDADIYVGLDYSVTAQAPYPWETDRRPVIDVMYLIPDMSVPKDAESFVAMIRWLAEQIRTGRKVHVGCIGGHGRTGMVLSALVAHFGERDAIAYVREHYCTRVVETGKQVGFLGDHFGILPVAESKPEKLVTESGFFGWGKASEWEGLEPWSGKGHRPGRPRKVSYHPKKNRSIWG